MVLMVPRRCCEGERVQKKAGGLQSNWPIARPCIGPAAAGFFCWLHGCIALLQALHCTALALALALSSSAMMLAMTVIVIALSSEGDGPDGSSRSDWTTAHGRDASTPIASADATC